MYSDEDGEHGQTARTWPGELEDEEDRGDRQEELAEVPAARRRSRGCTGARDRGAWRACRARRRSASPRYSRSRLAPCALLALPAALRSVGATSGTLVRRLGVLALGRRAALARRPSGDGWCSRVSAASQRSGGRCCVRTPRQGSRVACLSVTSLLAPDHPPRRPHGRPALPHRRRVRRPARRPRGPRAHPERLERRVRPGARRGERRRGRRRCCAARASTTCGCSSRARRRARPSSARRPGPAGRADRAAVRAPRRPAAGGRRGLGHARRSSRPSATAGSTAAARRTTRPASSRTSARCGCSATSSAWASRSSSRARRRSARRRSPRSCTRTATCSRPTSSSSPTRPTGRSASPALTTSLRGLVDCDGRGRRARPRGALGHVRRRGAGRADAARPPHRDAARRRGRRRRRRASCTHRTRPSTTTRPTFRADASVLDGVRLAGTGPITARLWTRPAIGVIGFDAPRVASASNTHHPARHGQALGPARARPGPGGGDGRRCARTCVEPRAVRGARRPSRDGEQGKPFQAPADSPAMQAARWAFAQSWGTEPVDIGVGGSIPFIADLLEVYPDGVDPGHGRRGPRQPRARRRTSRCTWASWRRSCSPRRCCWSGWRG